MENQFFTDKDAGYYNAEKDWMVRYIPDGPNVILDLGCAAGRFGRKLRGLNKAAELVGVEVFAAAAAEAEKYYDAVYQGDIEGLDLPYEQYFDIIICGDIIEHLSDPWTMITRIRRWLKDGGVLIASIPNVRYWCVLRDLIISGKWEYVEAGILDNTHLRFFTRSSFFGMLSRANFSVVRHDMIIHGKKKNLFNKLTFGVFEEFLGLQILAVVKKTKG